MAEQVRTFVELNGFHFPVVFDADGRMSEAFSVYGIPWSVVIDAQGVVRAIRPGPARDLEDLLGLVQSVVGK
ncbi:peroxiredoxin family protein [Geochorda subterranea]|uniref:TlpA disulfide reductase family protein n=1 Tax=Geochorda subterranea TaxID=3109564 RepID=A0ABZ1BST8_9FIRM|nr:TlpA disulfide reductase family protein [Limnochorda sp. LNt]WRP15696.1 TlpA disulfide reductase family protein [Limnochorda sp. LNt]